MDKIMLHQLLHLIKYFSLDMHFRLTTDTHSNTFTFNMLNKLIVKLTNHIL